MAQNDIQGFRDAHARLVGAVAEKLPPRPDFHWWAATDALDAAECLIEHCEKHGKDHVRFAVREGLTADGAWCAWLVVSVRNVDPTTGKGRWSIVGAFNVSHPCPPDCPNGDGDE